MLRLFLILSSLLPRKRGVEIPHLYRVKFDDLFAQKFIAHLRDDRKICNLCRPCINCRGEYKLNFSSFIVGILSLPGELPYFVDDPGRYLPPSLPPHDILIPINIHPDILLSLPPLIKKAGGKAILAPQESPFWIRRGVRKEINEICLKLGLEFSSPKPFCGLVPKDSHPFINKFIEEFRIGKPEIAVEKEGEIIKKVKVIRSAPCGNTYWVAHNLEGKRIDEKIIQLASRYFHSFPCIGSMYPDPELGDSILHQGGYNLLEAVHHALLK